MLICRGFRGRRKQDGPLCVSKMSSAVSKACLFGATQSFVPREKTDRGAGESVLLPQAIFQIPEICGGHIFGMTHEEHEDRWSRGYLCDEC